MRVKENMAGPALVPSGYIALELISNRARGQLDFLRLRERPCQFVQVRREAILIF